MFSCHFEFNIENTTKNTTVFSTVVAVNADVDVDAASKCDSRSTIDADSTAMV